MAATVCTLQPFGVARSGSLRASAPRTISASSLTHAISSQLSRLHLFRKQPAALMHVQRQLSGSRHRRLPLSVRAKGAKSQQPPTPPASEGGLSLGSVGLFLLWGGLVVYAFAFSTNQTPVRDTYIMQSLVGLGGEKAFKVNEVFKQLFFIMGVLPIIYTALLIPSGKSGNGVPAWPFVMASYGLGAFGLLPYMALWTPPEDPPAVPPAKKDMEGVGNLMLKGMESPVTAAIALLGGAACIYQAATAGPEAWADYFKLFDESRFVHITSIDFLTLSTLAPFWMYNDAQLRNWGPRDTLLPVLSVIPVLGPAFYLCLRPKAQ